MTTSFASHQSERPDAIFINSLWWVLLWTIVGGISSYIHNPSQYQLSPWLLTAELFVGIAIFMWLSPSLQGKLLSGFLGLVSGYSGWSWILIVSGGVTPIRLDWASYLYWFGPAQLAAVGGYSLQSQQTRSAIISSPRGSFG